MSVHDGDESDSGTNSGGPPREGAAVPGLDRLDALLSARMDGELTLEERVELEALLEKYPDHALRSRALDAVDAELRALAEEPIADERLATTYADLRTSLGFDEPVASATNRTSFWGGPVVPLLLAAAAALVFYLVLPMGPPSLDEDIVISDVGLDAPLEDELAIALGYGDEMSEISGITSDDLDVIEQLDLLDFITTHEMLAGEPEESG